MSRNQQTVFADTKVVYSKASGSNSSLKIRISILSQAICVLRMVRKVGVHSTNLSDTYASYDLGQLMKNYKV